MEFIIQKNDFKNCLQKVQGIIEKRTFMPISETVLLEARDGKLYYSATDLEIGMHGSCEANVIKEGEVALLSKKLFEIVKELSEDEVYFKLEEKEEDSKRVEILCGKTSFSMLGMSYEDFPTFPIYDDVEYFALNSEIVKEMIRKTIFAVSGNERRSLRGIFFVQENGTIKMVAVDGHKLSLIERKAAGGYYNFEKGTILPKKGMNEVRKILEKEKEQENTLIGLSDNNAVFKINDLTIIMRLLEGEFPEYMNFIPGENDNIVMVDRALLLNSLRRVSVVSEDNIVKPIEMNISTEKIELFSKEINYESAYDEIPADYEGDETRIGFNAVYFMEILNVLDSDYVSILFKDQETGIIVRPASDNTHTCVLMPMAVLNN